MKPKILLVEDEDDIRNILSKRLRKREFEVVTAADGEEGCAMALAERPDLILMDMNLPKLDGWQATQRLKKEPTTGSIPIIALTADVIEGKCEKALAAGCDAFEMKPIDFPSLLAKVQVLLQRRNAL